MAMISSYSLTGREVTALSLLARGLKWGDFQPGYKREIRGFARRIAIAIYGKQKNLKIPVFVNSVELDTANYFILKMRKTN